MKVKLAVAAFAALLLASAAQPAVPAEDGALPGRLQLLRAPGEFDFVQTPRSVVVGLRDLDLLRRDLPRLKLAVAFLDAAGKPLDEFIVDYAHEATPSHVVFTKAPDKAYVRVRVRLVEPNAAAFERTFDLPPAREDAPRAPLSNETADLVPGTGFDRGAAPTIRLLDADKLETVALPAPSRTVAVEDCRKRVVADFNFPIASPRAVVTRTTASPDDAAKKSLYIPCNSDLYDGATGAYQSTMKYLIELPLNPEWVAAAGDATVQAPTGSLRIHMTAEEINTPHVGRERLTSNQKGLLGQLINSYVTDEDGNIYFSMLYRGPIRFNVRKAKWEAPPVEVYDFIRAHLPQPRDLSYPAGTVSDVRSDYSNVIYCHQRRLWICPTRYAMVGKTGTGGNSLFTASVCSIPVDHWDDRAAFEKEMRFNATSVPGSAISLWPAPVKRDDQQRKLNLLMPAGNRICLLAYHMNYFWIMDLNDDGSTKKLTPLTHFQGKRIVSFEYGGKWRRDGGQFLGLELAFTLEGETKPRRVFLPMDATAPTEELPKTGETVLSHTLAGQSAEITSTDSGYGRFVVNKRTLAPMLGAPPRGDGVLTIYYDAIAALHALPAPWKDVVAQMDAASLGPEYYLAAAPGRTMDVLGTCDYPMYNFARYDCAGGAATVRKTFLVPDMGEITSKLSLSAKLGLYCHQWFRDGEDDVIYYAGYTGIARMVYSRGGRALDRHMPDVLTYKMPHVCVDGAPDAFIKWFYDIIPGLGDKVLLTGVNQTGRGGTAYSGGLMYFHRNAPNQLYKLSAMSRAYNAGHLGTRLRGIPGGAFEQDIFLNGNFSASDGETLPPEKRPTNTAPRIFVYRDGADGGVRDLYGFTLTPAAARAGIATFSVATNGLYLVLLLRDGTLATFDLDAGRFAHAVKVAGATGFLQAPDGSLFLVVPEPRKGPAAAELQDGARAAERTWRDYLPLTIEPSGAVRLGASLRFTFPAGESLGRATFLYDSERDDGSYALVFGPNSAKPEASIRILRDFLPPRTAARGAK